MTVKDLMIGDWVVSDIHGQGKVTTYRNRATEMLNKLYLNFEDTLREAFAMGYKTCLDELGEYIDKCNNPCEEIKDFKHIHEMEYEVFSKPEESELIQPKVDYSALDGIHAFDAHSLIAEPNRKLITRDGRKITSYSINEIDSSFPLSDGELVVFVTDETGDGWTVMQNGKQLEGCDWENDVFFDDRQE